MDIDNYAFLPRKIILQHIDGFFKVDGELVRENEVDYLVRHNDGKYRVYSKLEYTEVTA